VSLRCIPSFFLIMTVVTEGRNWSSLEKKSRLHTGWWFRWHHSRQQRFYCLCITWHTGFTILHNSLSSCFPFLALHCNTLHARTHHPFFSGVKVSQTRGQRQWSVDGKCTLMEQHRRHYSCISTFSSVSTPLNGRSWLLWFFQTRKRLCRCRAIPQVI